MEQYIDKAALIAEIKKLHGNPFYRMAIKDVLSILDILEVKEIGVDIGSPDGDTSVKTIWDGNKIVSNKARKGE